MSISVKAPPEAPTAPPPQGGAASGPAKPVPRQPSNLRHSFQLGFRFSAKAVTPSCAQPSIMFTAMVWLASW
ncbi:hypothetical protein EEB15_32125 [Ramlibacter sp. WS9]|nr:hypothetical protein EEB15_32125 [Ramlibacter sp. WS9]